MIGDRIRYYMKQQKITQQVMAEKLGVTRQAVSSWVQNVYVPSYNHIFAIAEVLGINPYYLLSEDKTAEEMELEGIYKELSEDERILLLNFARMLKERGN